MVCVCVIITLARAEEGDCLVQGTLFFLKSDSLYGRPSLSAPSPKSTPLSISAHALGADWHVGEVH